MEIVVLIPGSRGGLCAEIYGKIAFPDRRYPLPSEAEFGQIWEVEVSGENPRKTVLFFRAVRRVPRGTKRMKVELSGFCRELEDPAEGVVYNTSFVGKGGNAYGRGSHGTSQREKFRWHRKVLWNHPRVGDPITVSFHDDGKYWLFGVGRSEELDPQPQLPADWEKYV